MVKNKTPHATATQNTPTRYDDLPDLCTVRQAQAFLQASRTSTYNLIKTGAIPSKRFGNLIRVPKTALLDNKASR
jgi:excisionase family DNA binding protein